MSTFEANWEVGLVTAEAVHGIGFAMELQLEDAEDAAGRTVACERVDAAD
ncbi:hypothetical protein [Symbiobacterium terraclitae]